MYNYTAPATLADINLFLRDIIFGKHVSTFHPGQSFTTYTWGNGARKFNEADAAKLDAHLATCRDLCATLGTSLGVLSNQYTALTNTALTLRVGESQPVLSLGENGRCFPSVCRGTICRTREGYYSRDGVLSFKVTNHGYLPDTAANRKTLKALAAKLNRDWREAVDAQLARVRQLA